MRPGEAKQTLESALDNATQAITEARDAVHELRSSTVVTSDLPAAITALGEELAANDTTPAASQDSATFLVGVQGTPQEMRPILQYEVYRIAGEGLRNAFRQMTYVCRVDDQRRLDNFTSMSHKAAIRSSLNCGQRLSECESLAPRIEFELGLTHLLGPATNSYRRKTREQAAN